MSLAALFVRSYDISMSTAALVRVPMLDMPPSESPIAACEVNEAPTSAIA